MNCKTDQTVCPYFLRVLFSTSTNKMTSLENSNIPFWDAQAPIDQIFRRKRLHNQKLEPVPKRRVFSGGLDSDLSAVSSVGTGEVIGPVENESCRLVPFTDTLLSLRGSSGSGYAAAASPVLVRMRSASMRTARTSGSSFAPKRREVLDETRVESG
ncbi:MAG: hypothetical protein PWQ29_1314 [Verrucomicrobiota bacterium]|jgi:hypothetical protein|nr:hypothetical protein [Verrucomicrobiota bacterium]